MRALRDDERLIPFFERLIPFGGGLFVYSVFGVARGDDKRLGRVVKVGASGWEGLYGSLLCILNAHLRHSSDSERESSVIHQNIHVVESSRERRGQCCDQIESLLGKFRAANSGRQIQGGKSGGQIRAGVGWGGVG